MKLIVFIFCLVLSNALQAQLTDLPAVFPRPQQMQVAEGKFILSAFNTFIRSNQENTAAAAFLNQQLNKQYGFTLKQAITGFNSNYICLAIKKNNADAKESYQLIVSADSIVITGSDAAGLFYGIQTLLQLIEKKPIKKETPRYSYSVPAIEITDAPRFAYRGMHLDVCRHFFTVAQVKQYIDFLAAYKFNTFHWHLTDDQGWRIEIKKYPKLTSVGGWRNGTIIGRYPGKGNDGKKYGGFYTQEQIKEVVRYATDHYITIIPEIEMPGHASAAIAAYPQLSCFPNESTQHPKECAWAGDTTGKQVQQTWGVFEDVFCPSDYTFKFLQDVVDEVLPLFPSKYIHIGGDECPKTAWKRSAFCQDLMKKNNLKNEHELQSYFIQRIEKYINNKGRRIIGWDEILEGGLAPNATVMSWTGEEGGIKAAQQNHDVVMTPGEYCYFDHSQTRNEDSVTIGGYLPIEKVYSYDPVPAILKGDEARHILGAQANLWTEYITNPFKIQYMIFPRIAAMSEVLWTKKENKSQDDFEKRLPVLFDRLERKNIHYSKAYYTIVDSVMPAPDRNGVVWKVSSKMPDGAFGIIKQIHDNVHDPTGTIGVYKDSVVLNGEGVSLINVNKSGLQEISLFKSTTSENHIFIVNSISKSFSFNKATGKNISLTIPPSKSYPGTGAFTLVDGIQNEKKLERSSEFLGFNGKDCEATIDLGKTNTISKVMVHCLNQQPSWIYLPKTIELSISNDGTDYTTRPVFTIPAGQPGNNVFTLPVSAATGRYIKLKITNAGTIPDGLPGAGNPAWLFVDEIEVW